MFMVGDMNLVQRGASPAVQDGLVYSQAQSQALRSMALPQQLDVSLYGTPIASVRNNLSQYSPGISQDSANVLTKGSDNQAEKPIMQSSAFSNSFLGDNCNVSSDQLCMPDGAFISKNVLQAKNLFGKVPIHGLNGGVVPDNFEQVNTLQRNESAQDFNGRQERAGWSGLFPGKTTQVSASQGLATLDPLEQKILFNMDDNSWDASFGRHADMGTGGFGNTLESTDYLNSFPSIQSGSWSALMQSAVAEASSSDTGLQEEWSGLSFQNAELSTDNQPSNFVDSGKQQTGWVGSNIQNTSSLRSTHNQPSNFVDSGKQQTGWVDSNIQNTSSLSSKPQVLFNDSNTSSIFPGFQQSGIQFSIKQREGMCSDFSHESIQQSAKNSIHWLDCNPQQKQPVEGSQPVQSLPSLENRWRGQNYEHPESDAHQQSISSYNNGGQPCNRPMDRSMKSPSRSGNVIPKVCDNEIAVNKFCAGDINEVVYKEKDPDRRLWKTENNRVASSFSNSVGGLEQLKSGRENKIVEREDSQLNNFAAIPDSSMTKVHQETSRHVPESHQLDYMKHIDVSVKNKGHESMGTDQCQLSNNPQVLVNSYKGAGDIYDKQRNCYQRQNSSDSFHSNTSQHAITGHELRENVWPHGSDSQPVAGSNQKTSGQVGFTFRRFLCHPLGNLGVNMEHADTTEYVTNSQVLCRQVSQGLSGEEQGYLGQFKFIGNVSNGAMDLEKGHLPDVQRNSKASEEVPPRGNVGTNLSASFDTSVGFYSPNVTVQTSQNVLELLHKVDQDGEHSTVRHFGSNDSNPLSEVPETETPDAAAAQQYDHSSAAQHFGLRLAPPSQWLPNSNSLFSSQSSPQTGNSTATSSLSPPYSRNQFQRQQLPAVPVASQSPQAVLAGMTSKLPCYNRATSQDTSHPICTNPFGQQFPILESVPVTQPSVMSGMSQQVGLSIRPPSAWTNVSTQRHVFGTEPRNLPSSLLLSTETTNNSLETTSWAPQDLQGQNSYRGGTASLEFGKCSMNSQGLDYGEEQPGKERSQQQISPEILNTASQTGGLSNWQESVAKNLSEANAIGSALLIAHSHQQDFDRARHGDNLTPAVSARDLEAFGRSLRPSHVHQNHSLLSQVHSMKNLENDQNRKVSDKYNGADSDLNLQQITAVAGHSSGVKNPVNNELNAASWLNSYPSRDIKMLNFPSEVRDHQSVKDSSQPFLQDTPQKMATLGQSYSQSHSTSSNVTSNRTELSQISLQMAPSWFKHYGTLKNGQLLPMYDARAAKNSAQQFPLGKPCENLHTNTSMVRVFATDASQVGSTWPTTATTWAAGKQSPPYVLPTEVTDQNLAIVRPKKRKIASTELLSWHKEVTQGSQRLENISMAELEWAQAVNRVIGKVEDESEMIEDVQPMHRPKKRLILTTQLMQQLFRPAPAAILSAEATSDYDMVVYFAARLALGDACSLTFCSRSDSVLSSDTCDLMSEKPQTSERSGEQSLSKIVEDFTDRAKKLETDLLRLDKRASILDIRLESQELEKFSVINRFVKFHSRGQADAAETSSSSGTTPTVLTTFPQRYVTALPMPMAIPEVAQCLSL
uniref:Uncharacterized protein n=1 Tax=Davidia involucrata TaxID=16924 RepID=A0A5B6ZF66_DAVIN